MTCPGVPSEIVRPQRLLAQRRQEAVADGVDRGSVVEQVRGRDIKARSKPLRRRLRFRSCSFLVKMTEELSVQASFRSLRVDGHELLQIAPSHLKKFMPGDAKTAKGRLHTQLLGH